MAILADKKTRLLVQGMGRMGQFHARLSLEYGTRVVGGVAPGKGGTSIDGIPAFDTVAQAVDATGANASMVFSSWSDLRTNGCLLNWTLAMSSVTTRAPKLIACWRTHSIISGPVAARLPAWSPATPSRFSRPDSSATGTSGPPRR